MRNLVEHRARPIELHSRLIYIIEERFFSDFDRPLIGSSFPQADPQERGFAGAVSAKDAGALGGFERDGQAAKEPSLALAFAHLGPNLHQVHRGITQSWWRRNEQVHLAFLRRGFEAFDIVKRFEAVPRFGTLG